jgi:hypothetical protein
MGAPLISKAATSALRAGFSMSHPKSSPATTDPSSSPASPTPTTRAGTRCHSFATLARRAPRAIVSQSGASTPGGGSVSSLCSSINSSVSRCMASCSNASHAPRATSRPSAASTLDESRLRCPSS